jgi:hypothetical protein
VPRKPAETVQVNLRMKEVMRRRLDQAAKKHGVSLNAEMMRRLEESFTQEEQRSLKEVTKRLELVAESLVSSAPKIGAPTLTQTRPKEEQK